MVVAAQGSGGPITTCADAVWWALTTITTVGYGDTYPVNCTRSRRGRRFDDYRHLALWAAHRQRCRIFVEEDTADRTPAELAQINQRIERIEQLLATLTQHL